MILKYSEINNIIFSIRKIKFVNIISKSEDMANAVYFFASDLSSYITGNIMEVAGGYGLGTPQYADYVGRKQVEDKQNNYKKQRVHLKVYKLLNLFKIQIDI